MDDRLPGSEFDTHRVESGPKRTSVSVMGFAGNPIAVSVHLFTIAGFARIDRSSSSSARRIAPRPIVAKPRCSRAHPADTNGHRLNDVDDPCSTIRSYCDTCDSRDYTKDASSQKDA